MQIKGELNPKAPHTDCVPLLWYVSVSVILEVAGLPMVCPVTQYKYTPKLWVLWIKKHERLHLIDCGV